MSSVDPRDPDAPDPHDRTMQRLELATGLEELFPGALARLAGAVQRRDVLLGWMSPATWPAGVQLAGSDESEPSREAVALPWRITNRPYVLVWPVHEPQIWVRAWPGLHPGSYSPEAALLTRELRPQGGIRRWHLLTADEQPVQLADDPSGRDQPRDWVLRADTAYQLEHDIEGGWRVYGLTGPTDPM